MNVTIWIISSLLALLFLAAGAMKVATPYEKIAADPNMSWAASMPSALVKFIGLAELAGAIGLIVPGAADTATWLVPAAALGLALAMVGAVVTHIVIKDVAHVIVPLVLFALATFVFIERVGPHTL